MEGLRDADGQGVGEQQHHADDEADRRPGEVAVRPVRRTLELVDNGFVSSINNTVGIGFGLDWLSPGDRNVFWVPVVMQWNFWLSDEWSVFGEPGGGLYFGKASGFSPAFYAGGRYHFNDAIALTMRRVRTVGSSSRSKASSSRTRRSGSNSSLTAS